MYNSENECHVVVYSIRKYKRDNWQKAKRQLTAKRQLHPQVLLLYADRGTEHRTNYLIVKIPIIALQKFLNLDQIVVAQIAQGTISKTQIKRSTVILILVCSILDARINVLPMLNLNFKLRSVVLCRCCAL